MSVHLTVAQIAERLGIAPGKILTWISTGELAAIDTSASRNQRPRWRIDPADLEIFLASRRSAPPVKPARAKRRKTAKVTQYIT